MTKVMCCSTMRCVPAACSTSTWPEVNRAILCDDSPHLLHEEAHRDVEGLDGGAVGRA